MSRIGRLPVPVPDNVKLAVNGSEVTVEGPLGKLTHRVSRGIACEMDPEKKQLVVTRASDAKPYRERHGLERTLISNMIIGVTQGYRKELEIVGIGYNVKPAGKNLEFQLGFANPVSIEIPEGLKAEVIQPTNPGRIAISGCDKQQVGQVAARIRALRSPEPYLGKGIRYSNEVVRRKAGKAFVGAG